MSSFDIADLMMRSLRESGAFDSLFKYKQSDGSACCICGSTDSHMAFGLIRGSQKSSNGSHASFQQNVCIKCAPPCGKCGLPIVTEVVQQHLTKIQSEDAESISVDLGTHCRHRRFLGFTF